MIQTFNVFGEYKIPDVSICYPNRVKIGDLGVITDFPIDIKFNTYSEISIEVPYQVDGVLTPHYDHLVSRNKLHVDGYGYFIIQDVKEVGDGIEKKKTVPAYSEECFFNKRSVNFLEGTYKFYDVNPATETIMSKIMGYIPNWTIGSISSSLWSKYRSFDTTSATLYSFMMNDVSKAYECFFIFDTENRILYVKDATDVVNSVPIYLSYDNVIKELNITEKEDEYVTALSVTGGGDLDIRSVNPLGTNFIYDFSYPISQNQMTTDLADAVTAWDALIDSLQSTYATALSDYKTANETLLGYESDLADLNAEKNAINLTMLARIQDGQTDMSDLVAAIAVVDAGISAVQSDITDEEAVRDAKYAILLGINDTLAIENNFTTDEYNELLDYIIESSYQNENIIETSVMTNVEIQEQAQELYDQGINILAKISQPRFEFTLDSANFVFLKEYLQVTNLLEIGSVINIELDETRTATPVLLEIKFNFYQPNDFSLTFGNRYRLDDSAYEFAELIQDTINQGSNIGVNAQFWKDWSTNYRSDVSDFVSNSLDASKNNLINATNQQIIIDEVGLRGKQLLESGEYSPEQAWLTGNTLAFTDDAWNTVRVALGKVTLPDSSTTYGLIADAIVTGVLNAGLVQIFGTNDFYWDNNNIVLKFPSDANKEIRIGQYDETNYGIGFTTDGGDTWGVAIGFDGTVLSAADETRLSDAEAEIIVNADNILLRVEETTYYRAVPIYSATDPSSGWTLEQKVTYIGYLWYDTNTDIIWKWNGVVWINTLPVDSAVDPSLTWTVQQKADYVNYLWGDTNGTTIIDYEIALSTQAVLTTGINYILIYTNGTKIINQLYETIQAYAQKGDVMYATSVVNNNTVRTVAGDTVVDNWYVVLYGGITCIINQNKARALTVNEQIAYLGGYLNVGV
jgi:hypothetical protein